jgi:translation initiation factor IF-1
MSKEDLVNLEGTITDIKGGGMYSINLENGVSISARLCGKMKRFKIRIVPGDRVTVAVSPYDVTHGLIMFRHKN